MKFIASPNYDDRPLNTVINMVVIHGISLPAGEFGGEDVIALFTDPQSKLSAHIFIRRDGETIQFVPFEKRAWHAGQSSFEGQENCNDFSIGIELEGTDEIDYTEGQYQTLVEIINNLKKTYPPITDNRIIGHSDIAPGRKTDPGPFFRWDVLKRA